MITNYKFDFDDIEEEDLDCCYDELHDLFQSYDKGEGNYIIIANLGLWNGRKLGYLEIKRLTQLIDEVQFTALYIQKGILMMQNAHHDGTNYYYLRQWKSNVTNKEIFKSKLMQLGARGLLPKDAEVKKLLNAYTKNVYFD